MFKTKIFITLIIVSVCFIAFAQVWKNPPEAFSLAQKVPREALIYVQTDDLPALVKLWNESELKQDYAASANFAEFQDRRLFLKLVSRLEEFNAAIGFSFDLAALSGLSKKKAALAIYDIGRLEAVFVAPLSDEEFAATMFFQNRENFETETLADATEIYSVKVEADRGRQPQKLFFANKNGLFILATSEKLFGQTFALTERNRKNLALWNAPNFQKLCERIVPKTATVWLNQEKLNEDYYFKRYWLMSAPEDLKNIRAVMLDLEISAEKVTEKREFLLKEAVSSNNVRGAIKELRQIQSTVLKDAPFSEIQTVGKNAELPTELVLKTVFDRVLPNEQSENEDYYAPNYEDYDFTEEAESGDYDNLSFDFEREVTQPKNKSDEKSGAGETENEKDLATKLHRILQATNPQAALSATNPHFSEGLPFIEFRRVAVLQLGSPKDFRRAEFEAVLAEIFLRRFTIDDKKSKLLWRQKTEKDQTHRELELPALGQKIGYLLKGDKLFIANNINLLSEIIADSETTEKADKMQENFDELTVIRFENREEIFDNVMRKITPSKSAERDFFIGNIGSLLDILQKVEKIEIQRQNKDNFRQEKIDFILKKPEEMNNSVN